MFVVHASLVSTDAVDVTDGVSIDSAAVVEITSVGGDIFIGDAADNCHRLLSAGDAVSFGVSTGDQLYVQGMSNPGYSARVTAVFHDGLSAGGGGGSAGADGKSVLNGIGAPDSVTGSDGDFYIDTDADDIYGPKADGAWGVGVSLVGPQGATGATGSAGAKGDTGSAGSTGAAGTNGNTVLNGSGAPTTQGVNGDFWIDTTNWDIYGPKTGSGWGTGTSLIGPAA